MSREPAPVLPHPSSPTSNGGNGGDVRQRLRVLENTVGRIEERLSHMPTKAFLLGVLVGPMAAAIVALVIALIRAIGSTP